MPGSNDASLPLYTMESYQALFGMKDRHISIIESECHVKIIIRESNFSVSGDERDVTAAIDVLRVLSDIIYRHEPIDGQIIRFVISMVYEGKSDLIYGALNTVIAVTHRGMQIKCRSYGQLRFIESVKSHDLTFAIGPAGTGKTYLAVAVAVSAFRAKEAERIILTRPAVEAGEKLGFLPGDLSQKVDPYLRPLYDALYELLGSDVCQRLIEKGVIEAAPLAYMRGRTLSDSFIILDEAQNTTGEQMKMFLTRMGSRSKTIISGDVTQTDLPAGKRSGLEEAVDLLKYIPEIGIVYLNDSDIVRHDLVRKIVKAYERHSSAVRNEGMYQNG